MFQRVSPWESRGLRTFPPHAAVDDWSSCLIFLLSLSLGVVQHVGKSVINFAHKVVCASASPFGQATATDASVVDADA